jgi:hypothetical protein
MKAKEKVIFRLCGGLSTPYWTLNNKDQKRSRLLANHPEDGLMPIRYASNQKSPFVHEQNGEMIIEQIIFKDGDLVVDSRTQQPLLKFLRVHPRNGVDFEEFKPEEDAMKQVENLEYEAKAMALVSKMDITEMEVLFSVIFENGAAKAEKLTSQEIKRDVMMYAKNNPKSFLQLSSSAVGEVAHVARRAFALKIMTTRNSNKEIYYNLPENKSRLLIVPQGEDYLVHFESYLKSDEGKDLYVTLKNVLEGMLDA